ncbi:hypothetical protein LEP1GSC199_4091 [Leptospira vanthielii serovar Holland str. Waz Holland = ATCC 700522]|uniref:Uncharacterized protein n=1 Tax=Leptospira vanthielii serovar Holland str. Waz Holland = ATCC 700522 TaxID=1218591 RepID=N1WC36_9LEPT|nr:hypothetical protein LEP1GSC199_4091 [Leptospira vanthielii serovar Holland str. Waz Holland = ATCC 700522]
MQSNKSGNLERVFKEYGLPQAIKSDNGYLLQVRPLAA